MSNSDFEQLVPVADTKSLGLGIGRRSVGRRIKNPPAGFPVPVRSNGRLYFRRSELEEYKQRLIREALDAPEGAAVAHAPALTGVA